MSPSRQADVLHQLGEADRLIVQRILDHSAVQRSNDSALSGMTQRSHTRPASPTGSDSSPRPPSYPGNAGGSSRAGNSRPSARPASPQEGHPGELRGSAEQGRRSSTESSASRGHTGTLQKPTSAADLGIFDFDSQSSAELDEGRGEAPGGEANLPESRFAESRAAGAAAHEAPQRAQPGLLFWVMLPAVCLCVVWPLSVCAWYHHCPSVHVITALTMLNSSCHIVHCVVGCVISGLRMT